MGLIRKTTSVFSGGAVDFRSAKDRTAAHTASAARSGRKQTRIARRSHRQIKKQTQLLRQQSRMAVGYATAQPAHLAAQLTAAGWYGCPTDPAGSVRYWDGQTWTGWFKP